MKDEKAKRLQGRQVGQKASTEKRNPLEGIKLKKVPRTESESSASGTPSSSRRGTLTELPEFVRRSSGVSGDVSRKGSLVVRMRDKSYSPLCFFLLTCSVAHIHFVQLQLCIEKHSTEEPRRLCLLINRQV